jgi:hypothetical protein
MSTKIETFAYIKGHWYFFHKENHADLISVEAVRFISDCLKWDFKDRQFPEELHAHSYLKLNLEMAPSIRDTLKKANYSEIEPHLEFNLKSDEKWQTFYAKCL